MPAAASSMSIKAPFFAFSVAKRIHCRREEKVLRSFSIDCSSPISTNQPVIMGTSEFGSAGIPQPHCTITVDKPMVFIATDLPPAFGPVIIRHRSLGSILNCRGTMGSASFWPMFLIFNSGLWAFLRSNTPLGDSSGMEPDNSRVHWAFAYT